MPRLALTFDDGPGPITAELLDILRDAGVRATFFVLGRNVEEAPWCSGDSARARAVVVRALREGHVVGNHTWGHGRPEQWREFAADVRRGERVVRALRREANLPEEDAIPFRLPYGIRLVEKTLPVATGTLNATILDPRVPVLASLGLTHVHWTADFEDWTLDASGGAGLAARIIAHLEAQAALGLDAVVDLHDGGTDSQWGYARAATLAAVAEVLAQAGAQGWQTFSVPGSP